MRLILAPMQGLVDAVMRDLLTQIGGFDWCVSEFVRITHTVHSDSIWFKHVPELFSNCETNSGVPCVVQLLGSDPENMALNALNAVKLGAKTIDLNFGCPAPTVNKHKGGAALLTEPESIFKIVSTVRNRLPETIPLTAKMRLGFENTALTLICAEAIARAGACELTVHARTKVEGYTLPAHWEWLKVIADAVDIPIIANGDVFSLDDYVAIKEVSGCDRVMLGRGALMRPDLALQIKAYERGESVQPFAWETVHFWLGRFFDLCLAKAANHKYPAARLKQWLGMLKQTYPEALVLFDEIRALNDSMAIQEVLSAGIKK